MFVSHKSNVIQSIHETEWQCRRLVKGLDKSDYWAWLETVTTDHVPDYSGETDYSIVKTEVDVKGFNQSGHITSDVGGKYYHLKWDASKKEVVKDDDALTEFNKSVQWIRIRAERDRLLAETDWMMLSDTGTVSTAWKNYRKALREIPSSQDSVTKFKDITWPSKPS